MLNHKNKLKMYVKYAETSIASAARLLLFTVFEHHRVSYTLKRYRNVEFPAIFPESGSVGILF